MEPLTALSIASSVVQLVEFGGRLFQLSTQIQRSPSGVADEVIDLQLITSDLHALSERFRASRADSSEPDLALDNSMNFVHVRFQPDGSKSQPKLSKDERALLTLADRCHELSEELLVIIASVKSQSDGRCRTWKALLQAIRMLWKEKEIENISERLDALRSELLLHLVYTMKDDQACVQKTLRELIRSNGELKINNTFNLTSLRTEIMNMADQNSLEIKILEADTRERRNSDTRETATPEATLDAEQASQEMLNAIMTKLETVLRTSRDVSKSQSILASLQYKEMPLRYIQIPEACKSTYGLIFNHASFGP